MNNLITTIDVDIFSLLLFSNFLRSVFFVAKNLFLFLDAVLAIASVYVFIEALSLRPRFISSFQIKKTKSFPQASFSVADQWKKILEGAFLNPPQSLSLAIIEADKLVDGVLERLGFSGEGIGEKMEKLKTGEFKSLENLWQAHKIRNNIVHMPNFTVSESEAKKTLEAYEKFLKEAGVI